MAAFLLCLNKFLLSLSCLYIVFLFLTVNFFRIIFCSKFFRILLLYIPEFSADGDTVCTFPLFSPLLVGLFSHASNDFVSR